MNIVDMAKQANRYASNQTNDSHDWQVIRDERFAHLVRAAALDEAELALYRNAGKDKEEIAAAIRELKETK